MIVLSRHRALAQDLWSELAVRTAIEDIATNTIAHFDPDTFWLGHPSDDGVEDGNTSIYMGAAGVIWALAYLNRIGEFSMRTRNISSLAIAAPALFWFCVVAGAVPRGDTDGNGGPSLTEFQTMMQKRLLMFLDRDLAEIGAALGVQSQRFRELKLWADAATGRRKLGEGLKELNLLQPPSGAFPVSSFAAYHLIRMALSESQTNTAFLLTTYEAELRRRALADGAYDPKAMEILAFLIADQRPDQMAELDLAGWKRYRTAPYAASYLVGLSKAGRLSLTTPELADAVKEFPRSVLVQALALDEARKAGKSREELAPYIARVITAEYAQLNGLRGRRDSYLLKQLFADLAREL